MQSFFSFSAFCDEVQKFDLSYGIILGNFDGMHKGHQFLLKNFYESCKKNSLKSVVLTFSPHPRKILDPEVTGHLITTYDCKRSLLEKTDIDYYVEETFSRDFSALSPEGFVEDFLLKRPSPLKKVFVGHDFRYAKDKTGDFFSLQSKLALSSIEVERLDALLLNETTISSTFIREKIKEGNFEEVFNFLGRNFSLSGTVVKSKGRGKAIGFPTANISFDKDLVIPAIGVYATKAIIKGQVFYSLTNIGRNPTFEQQNTIHIETHILDFNEEIYGEILEVQFFSRLRDEKKFNGVKELVDQIHQDVKNAKKYFRM